MSIDIEHVSFSYGKHQVLRDVNASIPDGVLVNVLGPNGVGKSTLFRCILCLNSDYEGVIRVNGKDLRDLSVRERAREISYIPQTHAPVYNYKVRDVVLMSTAPTWEYSGRLAASRSSGRNKRLSASASGIWRTAMYTHISGGEQQLVLIARALAQNAKTIVMDEPTSALDYGNTVRVLSCVKQLAREGLSIVQSTHQPDQAFLFADKTLVVYDGTVEAYGDPKDVITAELVGRIYGVEVEVNSLYGDKVRVCVPTSEIREE